MPTFSAYEIWLCDWTGAQVALLSGPGLVSLEWQHVLNGPGVYRLELVAETSTPALFKIDYGVRVMRDYGAGLYEEYYGFHLDSEEWLQSGEVDEHYWASAGMSPEWLLDQPLVQPVPSPNPNYDTYDLWWANGPADDVMKQMVSESMGGGAATDRQFSYVTVQGNTGQGVSSSYEARYDRLLEVLQDMAGERGGADFRMARTGTGFEFRTYAPYYGTDRRVGNSAGNKPALFSLELENILYPSRQVIRHAEATAVYGGWQGGGMERTIYTATNATALAESPFRRREVFVDLRDVVQADVIPAMLAQALIDQGKQEVVTFTPVQTGACLYGRDWALGDLVTLDLWGSRYDMRIVEVSGRIDGSNEEEIVGTAELWTRGDVA